VICELNCIFGYNNASICDLLNLQFNVKIFEIIIIIKKKNAHVCWMEIKFAKPYHELI